MTQKLEVALFTAIKEAIESEHEYDLADSVVIVNRAHVESTVKITVQVTTVEEYFDTRVIPLCMLLNGDKPSIRLVKDVVEQIEKSSKKTSIK